LKLRPQKFSLKADIFPEVLGSPAQCRVKVRAFAVVTPGSGHQQQVALEILRYGGDAVAFQQVLAAMRQHLDVPREPIGAGGGLAPVAAPTVKSEAASISDGHQAPLQPLVDMLAAGPPKFQAEALWSLAAIASISAAEAVAVCAALLGAQGVFAVFTSFFSSTPEQHQDLNDKNNIDAALPAACLLSRLARHADTASCCELMTTVLPIALQSMAHESTDTLVRAELACAVRDAAVNSPTVSPCTKQVHSSLRQVLQTPACVEVQQPLREALLVLDQLQRC